MVRGLGLMSRLKLGFASMFSLLHEKGGLLPWTISFGDYAIPSLATFLTEFWRFLSGSWWRESVTAHSRSVSGTLRALLPLISPGGMVPSRRGASAGSYLEFVEKLAGSSRLISRTLCVFLGPDLSRLCSLSCGTWESLCFQCESPMVLAFVFFFFFAASCHLEGIAFCCVILVRLKAHRGIKWRQAMRIASLPEERWAALSMKYKTYKAVGRPRRRWEHEINDFVRSERTEDALNNVERNNNEWIKDTKKNQKGWMRMESKFAIAAAAAPGS